MMEKAYEAAGAGAEDMGVTNGPILSSVRSFYRFFGRRDADARLRKRVERDR